MCLYMPKIQCILYTPDHLSMPLLQHTLLTEGFLPGATGKKAARKPTGKKAARKPAGKKAAKKKPSS
jgi:hypothetical protein